MMKKMIGIVVCMLLIVTALPVIGGVNSSETDAEASTTNIVPSMNIWLVRGVFEYLDEDDEYIYLMPLTSRMIGIGPGLVYYRVWLYPIKISKPLTGIFTNDFSIVVFGICDEWDYKET